MNPPLCVLAAGARTPVGMEAAASAAAVRAGIMGLTDHPFMVNSTGELLKGALDRQIDPRIMGPNRLLPLAEAAMREACLPLDAAGSTPVRLAVFLGLPELRPGFTVQDGEAVRKGVAEFEDIPVKSKDIHIYPQGHASGFAALAVAADHLAKGEADACLVGGVDSYFHPDTVDWLQANRQLANAACPSGFIPGEGAGFCLLATDRFCAKLGVKARIRVADVAIGKEAKLIKSPDTCLGEGLTATVRDAVKGLRLPADRVNEILCDINGERYRTEEWGFACLHLASYFDNPTGYRSPAEFWGDQGAASVPLFVMLACQAAERGYAAGRRTLAWASSERGLRGAAVLEILEGQRGDGHAD